MSVHAATVDHEALYQDLAGLLKKHGANLSAMEMLVVAANMVGKLVALQDRRTVTPEQAMKVVAENLEHGNRDVNARLLANSGGSA